MKKILFKWRSVFAAALALSFTLQSCLKDNFDFDKLTGTEWNPNIAVPLVYASMGVYDILAHTDSSDIFVIDPTTGFIALVYEGEIFSFDASQIVQMPDQSAPTQSISLTAGEITTLATGSVTTTSSSTYTYTSTSGVEIDSVQLKAGILKVDLTSDFPHSGSLTVTLPSFKKSGLVFVGTIPINYNGSFVSASQSFDLTGYTADMTTTGTPNQFPIQYTLTLNNSGNTTTTANKISITPSFNSFKFSKVFGDFGQQSVAVEKDSILIRIFNNAIDGTFQLVDPKIRFNISNSFGFPVILEIPTRKTINLNTGVEKQLTFNSSMIYPFKINGPTLSQLGQTVTTNLTIDKSNSNITELITPTPKYFVYEANAKIDPVLPSGRHFLTDSSLMKVYTEIELPLEGYAYGFTIADTLNFEFGENVQEVESVLLRINIKNGFPVNVKMQLVFLDENYNPLDSLFAKGFEEIMLPGQVDATGKVIAPTSKISDVVFDQARVPNLLNARHVVVKGEAESLEGTTGKVVKIYDTYKLDVKLGLQVQGSIKL